jgi:hypothetical protein
MVFGDGCWTSAGPSMRGKDVSGLLRWCMRNVDLIGVVGGSHAFGKDDCCYLDQLLRNFDVR